MKKYNKLISMILITTFFVYNSACCKEVEANAVALTTEGIEALVTLLGLAGVEWDSGISLPDIQINESDITDAVLGYIEESAFSYDSSYEYLGRTVYVVENGLVNDYYVYDSANARYVKLTTMERSFYGTDLFELGTLSSEQINYLNEVGANADEQGNLVYSKEGISSFSDWFTSLFSNNVATVPIDGSGIGTLNAMYTFLDPYVCDCNAETFYNDLISRNNSIYVDGKSYYYLIYGVPRDKTCNSVFVGFSDSADHGIYQSGKYLFSDVLKGFGYCVSECSSCGFNTVSTYNSSGAFQFSSEYPYSILASGAYTGVGESSDVLFDEKKVLNINDSYFDVTAGSFADVVTGDNTFDDDVSDVIFGAVSLDGTVSEVATPGVTVEETDEGYKVLVPTNVGTVSIPTDTIAETDIPTDLDGTAETLETPTDVLGGIQNIWSWISNFFTNLYKMLMQLLKWFAGVLVGSGSLDLTKFKLNSEALTGVFPFCIPYDMVNILSLLHSEPITPVFEFDFSEIFDFSDDFIITIDFSIAEDLVDIIKSFEFLTFAIGLCVLTRNIIRG